MHTSHLFFFNDTAPTEIYTLSLHDALPIYFSAAELEAIVETAADLGRPVMSHAHGAEGIKRAVRAGVRSIEHGTFLDDEDRKSTRLNSSHGYISYAVFCLKKKKDD